MKQYIIGVYTTGGDVFSCEGVSEKQLQAIQKGMLPGKGIITLPKCAVHDGEKDTFHPVTFQCRFIVAVVIFKET